MGGWVHAGCTVVAGKQALLDRYTQDQACLWSSGIAGPLGGAI